MKKAPAKNENAFVHTKALSNSILMVVRGGTGSPLANPNPPPHPNI
jgi:hypothetical protein